MKIRFSSSAGFVGPSIVIMVLVVLTVPLVLFAAFQETKVKSRASGKSSTECVGLDCREASASASQLPKKSVIPQPTTKTKFYK